MKADVEWSKELKDLEDQISPDKFIELQLQEIER